MAYRASLPLQAVGASASTMQSSGNSFAKLLASTRLAGHTPAVPQVYTAPDAHLSRGDFGVKRPLPSRGKPVGTLRYVDIDAVDTREGQTSWTEREHEVMVSRRFKELNIRLDGPVQKRAGLEDRPGLLGPKFTTRFDPSTRRPVPTAYESVSDAKLRSHLQTEARLGRGPIYREHLSAGGTLASNPDEDGPFGRVSRDYGHSIALPVDFRRMDAKTFESFLQYVRRRRPDFQKQAALRAVLTERQKLVKRLNEEHYKLMLAAREHPTEEEREAARKAVPPLITEESIPLPDISSGEVNEMAESFVKDSVTSDLWDGSRDGSLVDGVWKSWLQHLDDKKAASSSSAQLPHATVASDGRQSGSLHPQGGLQYGQPDYIQHERFVDGVSARQIERANDNDTRQSAMGGRRSGRSLINGRGHHIAVAGHIAFMPLSYATTDARTQIDWSQSEPEKGVLTVKAASAQRVLNDASLANTTWGGLPAREMDKSASASLIVKKAAAESTSRDSTFDALRKNQLPVQYGALDMRVHAVQPRSYNNLARGKPGSRDWIGMIDGHLGYRSGMHEEAPLDFTSADFGDLIGSLNHNEPNLNNRRKGSSPFGVARGVGSAIYSDKGQRQAAGPTRRKRDENPMSVPRASSRMHVDRLLKDQRAKEGRAARTAAPKGPSLDVEE